MSSKNGHGPRGRALTYARVSSQEQAERGFSLAQQAERLRAWCAEQGYEVAGEFSDPGYSGASLERPALDALRDRLAEGGISVVVAQDRDRFSREPAFTYLLRREFEERGARLVALNSRGDDTPEGELTDALLDQLGKYERAKITERTRRGLLAKARRGLLVGTARPKYGFDYADEKRESFVVNEDEMRVVEQIMRLAAEGLGTIAIQKRLHNAGIRTRSGNKVWARPTLQQLIRDDAYLPLSYEEVAALVSPEAAERLERGKEYGIEWYNRQKVDTRTVAVPDAKGGGKVYKKRQIRTERPRSEWIAIPVPAALPRGLVERARQVNAANKGCERSRQARSWPLRGFLRCSCGRVMSSSTTIPKRSNGKSYYYYMCDDRRHRGSLSECRQKVISAPRTEEAVRAFVADLALRPEVLLGAVDRRIESERSRLRGDPDKDREAWAAKLAALAGQRKRAQDYAVEGLIEPEELRERLAGIEEQRALAERELAACEDRGGELRRLLALRETFAASWPDPSRLGEPGEDRRVAAEMVALDMLAPAQEGDFRLGTNDWMPPQRWRRAFAKLGLRATARPDGTVECEVFAVPKAPAPRTGGRRPSGAFRGLRRARGPPRPACGRRPRSL